MKKILALGCLLCFYASFSQIGFAPESDYKGFGRMVAMDGNVIAVSSCDVQNGFLNGSVYIYERSDNEIVPKAVLEHEDWELYQTTYGLLLAIKGDFIAVGTPLASGLGDFKGAVYVYRKVGDEWEFIQKIVSPNQNVADGFGNVQFIGDDLLIGDPQENDFVVNSGIRGGAYLYHYNGSSFELTQEFHRPGTNYFGRMAVSEGNLMVIASNEVEQMTYYHTYELEDGQWVFKEQSGLFLSGFFTLSQGKLFTAGYMSFSNQFTQAAILDYSEGQWEIAQNLELPDYGMYFSAVAVSGNTFLIGGYNHTNTGRQPVLVYKNTGDEWSFQQAIYSDQQENITDSFGSNMASGTDGFLIGSQNYSDSLADYGKAFYIPFSSLAAPEEVSPTNEVALFPNPSNGLLNIRLAQGISLSQIVVSDMKGSQLIVQDSPGAFVDIAELASGIYLIQMHFFDGTKATRRFIRS